MVTKKWELKKGDRDYDHEDLLSRFMNSTLDFGFRDQDEKRKFLRDIVISFVLAGNIFLPVLCYFASSIHLVVGISGLELARCF